MSSASNVVSLKQPNQPKQSAMDQLIALVQDDLTATNQLIIDRMQSDVALIPQLAGYLVAAGGKRLRPVLTLASAQLCGYTGERHRGLASCVEFIHTATLLHDDVVDESSLRRGQASANEVWGNQASVLVGDFLFSRSFELMIEDGSLEVLRILSAASSTIAEGEVLQLSVVSDLSVSEQDYLKVIEAKTAALFAAACEVGAVVANQNEEHQAALRSYGMNLGVAFQLVDDALDYSAKQADLGKAVGDDFREGKITLPLLLAYRRGDEKERAFWARVIAELDQSEGDLDQALQLMAKHDTLTATLERAQHYVNMAKDDLAIFADSPIKTAMMDVADYCVVRGS